MNYLGIDVSKPNSRYVLLDNDGEKVAKSFTLENNQQSFIKLLERLKELNLQPDGLSSALRLPESGGKTFTAS